MAPNTSVLLLAALFSTVVHAQADSAQYNFESGAQGWTPTGAAISSAATSSARSWAGASALTVQFSAAGPAVGQQVSVPKPGNLKGQTITFHVFLPAGAAIAAVKVFAEEQRTVNGNRQPISALTLGAWNTLNVTVPARASPITRLGVEFETSGEFVGVIFVDSVGWGSRSAPPRTRAWPMRAPRSSTPALRWSMPAPRWWTRAR